VTQVANAEDDPLDITSAQQTQLVDDKWFSLNLDQRFGNARRNRLQACRKSPGKYGYWQQFSSQFSVLSSRFLN